MGQRLIYEEIGGSGDIRDVSTTNPLPVQTIGGGSSSAGGGSAGGGSSSYSTEQGDFTAAVTDATNNIVLSVDTVGGKTIDEATFANAILKVWDASTEEMISITLDDFDWTSGTKTLDTTNCTGAFTFATGDLVSLTIVGPDKNRDAGSDAEKGLELAPIYTHHAPLLNVEVTNETNATNNRYVDVSSYSKVKAQFDGVAGTDTITFAMEASMQDDGTVASSAAYADISQYGVSILTAAATAASYTADATFDIDVRGVKFLNLKTVSSGGSNDGDYNLYVRQAY